MKKFSYGQVAVATLIISMGTGFIIGYQYEVATPFISSVAIETVLPFGWFWRSVHFWSSQAFVVFLCLHCFDTRIQITSQDTRQAIKRHWSIISLSIPLAIFALFSGYVLRFDGTGQAAGAIAEHLLLNIPLFGNSLNRFIMAISTEGLDRLYIVHILAGAICWLLGTWYHTKRVRLSLETFMGILLISIIFCLFISAPINLPQEHTHLIKGPWFFLGVQELLRHFDPLLAGIILPSIPVILVAILPWFKQKELIYLIFLLWTFGYTGVTLLGLLRTG